MNVLQVYFDSKEVYACIVTCGGLCPGLNTVIRELVCGLYHMYGVHKVLGIEVCIIYMTLLNFLDFVSLKYDLDCSGLVECRVDIEVFTREIQFL